MKVTITTHHKLTEPLARCFAYTLKTDLISLHGLGTGDNLLLEIDDDNAKGIPEGACHSHDHCDANVTMAQAFRMLMGVSPDLNSADHNKLWEDAWTHAKAAGFANLIDFIETED